MSMWFHSTRHLSRTSLLPLSTLRPHHPTRQLSRRAFDDGGVSVLVTSFEPYRQVAKLLSRFAVGFSRLMEDMMSYHHIQEATLTRATLDRKIHRDAQIRRRRLRMHEMHGIRVVSARDGGEVMFLPSDSYRYPRSSEGGTSSTRDTSKDWTSRRRPQEHLRQLARDLSVTAPTVLVSMAPFVGYGFMVMGMLFPRLLLSRQFHTKGQRGEFAMEEYGQRARHYGRLSGVFWGSCMRSVPRLRRTGSREVAEDENKEGPDNAGLPSYLEPFGYTGSDAAGPVFDRRAMRTLYRLTTSMNSGKRQGAALRCLTSGHLESLALSNNVLSALPFWLVPDAHVRNKLETLAEDVLMDDAALIEEMIGFDGPCEGMADDEVLDACWLRGLPVGRFANAGGSAGPGIRRREEDEVREMRVALSNHLGMMEVLMTECRGLPSHDDFRSSSEIRSGRALVRDDVLKLLVLHLPAIRFSMKI